MNALPVTAVRILAPGFMTCLMAAADVVRQWDVDRSWPVHPTASPELVTTPQAQYLAYYNAERRLTLAWRRLDEPTWRIRHFPVVTRWATGAHAQIGLAVDRQGIIHLVPYRRDLSEAPAAPPNTIYFRSTRPHDPESMAATHMISPDEPNPHYPYFFANQDGDLFFLFRDGGSGRGNNHIHRHNLETGTWNPLAMLHDGHGRMSSYGGPRPGPDGLWHCLWMWRDTPDADTNHTLSYMVSADLVSWKSACGTDLQLPVRHGMERVVIEPAAPGEGLLNPHQWLGFDGKNRPVASYHRYAPCGNSAIYIARFEDGGWKRFAAHVWDFRWQFGGRGAISVELGAGPVQPIGENRLAIDVWSRKSGRQRVILDETTLQPLADDPGASTAVTSPAWRGVHKKPEIDFPARPMQVRWKAGSGTGTDPTLHYEVRWETGPTNVGDKPVPKPWPDAAPVRVFEIRTSEARLP